MKTRQTKTEKAAHSAPPVRATQSKKAGAQRVAELVEQVDKLGPLRDQIHTLQFQERALTVAVRETMEAFDLVAADGKRFHADLVKQSRLVVNDVAAFRKAAGDKVFLECVKVQIADAKRLLGEAKVHALADTQIVPLLQIRPRE